MNRSFALGVVAAFSASVMWGVQLPLAKDAFVSVDPYHLTAARFLLASLCLIPLVLWREGLQALSYRGHAGTAIGLGVIGMCGSPTLVFIGMSMSHAGHVVVIVSLQPAISALAFWILRGRKPANFTLACIAGAFLGVVLVVTRGQLDFVESSRQLIGDFLALGGALCWVIFTIGSARLSGWSTWRITILTMIPGALTSTLIAVAMVAFGGLTPPTLADYRAVGWDIVYLSVFGVVISMLAWNLGNRRIGALNALLFINLMPVVAFSYRALQGHQFERIELLGAGLVVGALIANNLYLRWSMQQAALTPQTT